MFVSARAKSDLNYVPPSTPTHSSIGVWKTKVYLLVYNNPYIEVVLNISYLTGRAFR